MMKKIGMPMMAILLSLLVLQLTVGVTFARCLHTGRMHIVSLTEAANKLHGDMQSEEGCTQMNGTAMNQQQCMDYFLEQLPASVQAPVFHHDFSAIVQPLLFTIWSLASLTTYGSALPQDVFCPDKVPIPPRAYLVKIRILLI